MAAANFNENGCYRPVVLTFVGVYLPGHKSGGPIRSVANLVEALKYDFDFRIITSDRDVGERRPYAGIPVNAWQKVGGANVIYLSPGPMRWIRIFRLLFTTNYNLIYVNSFFERTFSILPVFLKSFGLARRAPILLAPRGEFSPGALEIKASRKRLWLKFVKTIGIYTNVTWHGSAYEEKRDIVRIFTNLPSLTVAQPLTKGPTFVAPDLVIQNPAVTNEAGLVRKKTVDSLDVVFVSRICRKKNLDMALRILKGVLGKVNFNIYGIIEDAAYWSECCQLINELPLNVKADYRGELTHEQVPGVFQAHHLFLFPTRGENFGHVIIESLSAGCPVLLSDQTPWRQLLEIGVGWDLALDQVASFREVIDECVKMDDEMFQKVSQQAKEFGLGVVNNPQAVEQNRAMFQGVIQSTCLDGNMQNP